MWDLYQGICQCLQEKTHNAGCHPRIDSKQFAIKALTKILRFRYIWKWNIYNFLKFLICLVHYPVSSSVFGVSVYTGRLLGDKYHPAHLTLHLLCVNQFFICTRIAQKYHPPTLLCVLPTFHFTRIICTPTLPTLLYISQKFIHSKHIPHKYHPAHLTLCKLTFHFTRIQTELILHTNPTNLKFHCHCPIVISLKIT